MGRGRDEAEAAYFTLLRARDELTALRRYEEYLRAEQRRLHRSIAEADALEAAIEPRLRRRIAHTDAAMSRATRARLEVIDGELTRMPERLAAATAFVEECESDVTRHRGG
jgi:hypothetical protein